MVLFIKLISVVAFIEKVVLLDWFHYTSIELVKGKLYRELVRVDSGIIESQ